MHMTGAAKYKDGVLNLTKAGIRSIEGTGEMRPNKFQRSSAGGNDGPSFNKHPKKRSYEEISKVREDNPEYMTGKRFRKKKGNVGKKFKKAKKKGRK